MRCKIGEIIENKGLKKKYIAEQMGISQNQLSNWIYKRSYPPLDKTFKLSRLLNVSVEDLYEYNEE